MATQPGGAPPDKRRTYAEAFQAEARRLARGSRRTLAAARELGISPPAALALAAGAARGRRRARRSSARPGRTCPAYPARPPEAGRAPAGLILHSDQGSPYRATCFKNLLRQHGAVPSMSRRGNGDDNAHAESFWSRFKAGLLDGGSFSGLAEAKLAISHHGACYNAERRLSALGYLAPNHFETHLQTTAQFCPA